MTARRNSAGANFKFRRNYTMLLSSLVNSTALQELPHLQIQPLSSMIDFIRAEDLHLMSHFLLLVADLARANTTEFHSCEHDGIFAAAAKIINRMSGLERKFIMLNSTKVQINAIQI